MRIKITRFSGQRVGKNTIEEDTLYMANEYLVVWQGAVVGLHMRCELTIDNLGGYPFETEFFLPHTPPFDLKTMLLEQLTSALARFGHPSALTAIVGEEERQALLTRTQAQLAALEALDDRPSYLP